MKKICLLLSLTLIATNAIAQSASQDRRGGGSPIIRALDTNRDGVIYQEVPQPGHQRFNNTRTATEYGYDGTTFGSSGHLRVTVSPDEVRSEYIWSFLPGQKPRDRQNGQVAHEYTLRP